MSRKTKIILLLILNVSFILVYWTTTLIYSSLLSENCLGMNQVVFNLL